MDCLRAHRVFAALRDLPRHHHRPQAPFRRVVRRGNVQVLQESPQPIQHVLLQDAQSESLVRFRLQRRPVQQGVQAQSEKLTLMLISYSDILRFRVPCAEERPGRHSTDSFLELVLRGAPQPGTSVERIVLIRPSPARLDRPDPGDPRTRSGKARS